MPNVEWRGVNVENFAPVRRIHRSRGDGVIDGGIHVVPPEQIRAGKAEGEFTKFFPNLFALHETVRLFPKLYFRQGSIVPTVTDNSVLGRGKAGEITRLRRTGYRGKCSDD